MVRILIVDDEAVYRRQLEIGLHSNSYQIATAVNGRTAIDLGVRFRPDVLITDWMLKDDIHGLHLVHVLRAVLPTMRAILMTGYPSNHLRSEAGQTQVDDFIAKPFTLDQMRESVNRAVHQKEDIVTGPMLAVLDTNTQGNIAFASFRAKELLSQTCAGIGASNLHDLFDADHVPDLNAAIDRWVPVYPRSPEPIRWYLRSQESTDNGHRLLVIRHQNESRNADMALIEMLLGFKDYEHTRWPFDGRILVLDADALQCRWSISLLESVGAGCYAVETAPQAHRLLTTDVDIEFILVDATVIKDKITDVVAGFQAIRPRIVLVAVTDHDYAAECKAAGFTHVLHKPWRIEHLIECLMGRIGHCSECGLLLPLRHARSTEQAAHWQCTACGMDYLAVIDQEMPINIHHHVRPA